MSDDRHLGGMSERTHSGYLRAVRDLVGYSERAPAEIIEDQPRRFFLYLKNELNEEPVERCALRCRALRVLLALRGVHDSGNI